MEKKMVKLLLDLHLPPAGVKVLHLISSPFPSVWHTEQDTVANLDWAVAADVARVVGAFLAEYLGLPDGRGQHSAASKLY